jgi:endonuclease/exonuclease/phosphatase family metal-dependent hydrolase
MDGGRGVMTAERERVQSNLDGILEASAQMDPDVILYQEIDTNAARSHFIDEEITMINGLLKEDELRYSSAYADNLNVRFIPFPIPPIGKVKSGIMSFTGAFTSSAERIQLPCPFRWPVRLGNLKRCLLITRTPVRETDKELVLINLHLEAFDDGDGKIAQTKALRDILNEEAAKGNYVIAGGDFNQAFNNTDISAYPQQEGKWQPGTIDTEEFGDDWQCLMDSDVPTCRSLDQPYAGADHDTFQYYVIDGFIVSSNIEVKSCETRDIGFVQTDHNPVLMECVLK